MLLSLLIACGAPDGAYARVSAEGGAPVPVPRDLSSSLVEVTSGESSGGAWLYLLSEDPGCEAILGAPEATGEAGWLLYEEMGLAFELSFESYDGGAMIWEEVYWAGGAWSPSGTRELDAWVFGDGRVFSLDGGWLALDSHDEAEATGSFSVPWYEGGFTAENCGATTTGGVEG